MAKVLNSGRTIPQRVRNDLKFRVITVSKKQAVTDKFWRVSFQGTDLEGFNSPGTDDHIKLFFPEHPQDQPLIPTMSDAGIVWPTEQRPASRDYTPLEFDGQGNLTVDFFRHQGGVASQWAEEVEIGGQLVIGGPRGSLIIPTDYRQQLYVFDETGLPAMKRRLSQLKPEGITLIAFANQHLIEEYLGPLDAGITLHCLASSCMDDEGVSQCIALTDEIDFPSDDHFIWLTGEGKAVKQLSDHFTLQRSCSPELVRAVAYWHAKDQ